MNLTDEQKARLFDALHHDGVDNWSNYQGDNYQEVMNQIEVENKFDQVKEKIQPLFDIIEDEYSYEVDYPAGPDAGHSMTLTEHGIKTIVEWIAKNYE